MKTSLFKSLYFQVLTAIAIGILLGHFYPEIGEQMKPLGDGFVKLIKMIIAPVDSICQCNTPFNYLFRCFELQCLSR
ncbi:cation:dicarboxylate symporter family transporter, partial [Escherichia coli]|uniref:cation:dicarboxylate symporter family transporter n=1 Tax=Escherichia coli TaxID=562 RepID=UPI001FCEDD3B